MEEKMTEKKAIEFLAEHAKNKVLNNEISDSKGAEGFLDGFMQPILQAMLEAELTNHLKYKKSEVKKDVKEGEKNYRNGHGKTKNIKTKYGNVEIKTPRDRNGTFEPIIVGKGERTLSNFEEKCIALCAKGMSYRDIEKLMKEIYGVRISKDEIRTIIDSVSEEVEKWRNRQLNPIYAVVYADCMYVPVKCDYMSKKKAVYVLVGITKEGKKEILGIWMDETESGSKWCEIFGEIQARGVADILYVCSDGIAGMKNSLEAVFPHAHIQRCVVHLVRNLYSICNKKEAAKIVADFKKIYAAVTSEEAQKELKLFKEKYETKEKIVSKVEANMEHLEHLFELPAEIRKLIYTTNIVESVNSALRKVTRGKGAFTSNESVYKVLYLRISELEEKWSKPIKGWKIMQEQLIELHGDRYLRHIEL